MAEFKNVPAIRFKGFSSQWTKVDLSQIVDVRSGRDYKHLEIGDIPVYGTGGYMLSVNEALSVSEDAIGIGRKGTIDKPFILRAPFWTVDTLFYAVPKPKNDLQFIYDLFQKINWRQKDESTGVPSLSKGAINSISISSTSPDEQAQIGSYFQHLDKLVSLHQAKVNKLTNLKKAMLEKIFPKAGADVPEIRFKGFKGAWEEKTMGDFGNATSGTSIESEFSDNGKYKVISIGSYSERSTYTDQGIRANDSDKIKRRILNKDDLAMVLNDKTLLGNIIGRVLQIEDSDVYVYNQRTQRIEPDKKYYDAIFLYQMLNAPLIRKKIIKSSQGNTQIYVNWTKVKELKYLIPQLPEQKKIGLYFQNFDKLISLHQTELEKLYNLKKACLEKMFV